MDTYQFESHRLMHWAIDNKPEDVKFHPIILAGSARKNDKRPARLDIYVEDDLVLNVRGNEKLKDVYALIRIDGAAYTEYLLLQQKEKDSGAGNRDGIGNGEVRSVGESSKAHSVVHAQEDVEGGGSEADEASGREGVEARGSGGEVPGGVE